MPRNINIDFNPTGYTHDIYTGSTSATTTGVVCSGTTGSCLFVVDDTYISGSTTIWVKITCEGCKDQLYEVQLINNDCFYCELVGTAVYLGSNLTCNLGLTVTSTDSLGIANGTATATVTGSNGPVSYLWSDGQATQIATGLTGGDYTVVVSDTALSGCTLTGSTTIYENFNFSGNGLSKISFVNLNSTVPYTINWMGYSSSTYTATTSSPSYDFGTFRTGTITITSKDLSGINLINLVSMTGSSSPTPVLFNTYELYKLDGLTNAYIYGSGSFRAGITGYTSELPRNLEYLWNFTNSISGSTYDLPPNLKLLQLTGSNTISGNTSGLPRTLQNLYIDGFNTISGDTYGIPTGITSCTINGNNTIIGDTAGLPRVATAIGLQGLQDITGLTSNLPTGLTYVNIGGNHIGGSTSGLPVNLVNTYIYGSNTISGNTDGLPRTLVNVTIQGNNTIGGDTSKLPTGLTQCVIDGSNTISGNTSNMPTGLTFIQIIGNNTISGSTSGLPRNLTSVLIYGNNTISGDILGLPTGLTKVSIDGSNTISGDVANLPTTINWVALEGFNSANTYTSPRTWQSTMKVVDLQPTPSFSSTDIDNILKDLSGSTVTWSPDKIITLKGTRTSASDGAVLYLTGSPRNVTITITP
jgi:hypothetical protein